MAALWHLRWAPTIAHSVGLCLSRSYDPCEALVPDNPQRVGVSLTMRGTLRADMAELQARWCCESLSATARLALCTVATYGYQALQAPESPLTRLSLDLGLSLPQTEKLVVEAYRSSNGHPALSPEA